MKNTKFHICLQELESLLCLSIIPKKCFMKLGIKEHMFKNIPNPRYLLENPPIAKRSRWSHKNKESNIIKNANITIVELGENQPVTHTQKEGFFYMSLPNLETVTLRVESQGFVSVEKKIRVKEGLQKYYIFGRSKERQIINIQDL